MGRYYSSIFEENLNSFKFSLHFRLAFIREEGRMGRITAKNNNFMVNLVTPYLFNKGVTTTPFKVRQKTVNDKPAFKLFFFSFEDRNKFNHHKKKPAKSDKT